MKNKHALARLELLNEDSARWNDLAHNVIQITRSIQSEKTRCFCLVTGSIVMLLFLSIEANVLEFIVMTAIGFCTIKFYISFHLTMIRLRHERSESMSYLISVDDTLKTQRRISEDSISLLADTKQFKDWENNRIIYKSFRSILDDYGFVKK